MRSLLTSVHLFLHPIRSHHIMTYRVMSCDNISSRVVSCLGMSCQVIRAMSSPLMLNPLLFQFVVHSGSRVPSCFFFSSFSSPILRFLIHVLGFRGTRIPNLLRPQIGNDTLNANPMQRETKCDQLSNRISGAHCRPSRYLCDPKSLS